MSDKTTILRFAALFVGCLGMSASGSIYMFNAYANAIKKTYNTTQTSLEVMSSMGNLGICIGFPAGMFAERFGPRWTSLAALLITTLAFMLLYSTTYMKRFYHDNIWLQYIYFLVGGFGAIFMYMASLITSMQNFLPKHRGTVVGILDAAFSAGPAMVALTYGEVFVDGHVHDEQNQNLRGFYLMTACLFGIIGVLGIIILGSYPAEGLNTDPQMAGIVDQDSNVIMDSKDSIQKKAEEEEGPQVTGLKLLLNFDYHFLFWSYVFCAGLQLMFQTNVTTYLKSYRAEDKSTIFTVLIPVIATVSKLLCGLVSDLIVHKVPRVVILLLLNGFQTIVMVIMIFYSNKIGLLVLGVLAVGIANGANWCLTPTILSEYFGMMYFGRNWGWTMIGNALGGFAIQQVFGAIYDSNIHVESVTDCYGLKCFTWSFVMAAVLSFCACVFNLGLFERQRAAMKEEKVKTKAIIDKKIFDVNIELNSTDNSHAPPSYQEYK